MTHLEVSQLNLSDMTKTQLKLYVKKAREVWGEWIDLRKADIVALQQYLQDYQAWAANLAAIAEKMEEQEAIEEIPEVEADVSEFQDLPDFENGEPHVTTLSDFEGIDAPLGDWWVSCPLSCDPCNYQSCDLPQTDLIESLEKMFLAPEPDDAAQVRAAMADSTVILQSQSSTLTTYYQYRGIDIRVCEESGSSYYQVRCWVSLFDADCDSGDVEESLSMARAAIDRRILFEPTDIEARLVREIRYRRDLENQDIPF